jgi:predicted kinase
MAEARGFDPAAVARLHAESRASLDRLAPLLDRRAGAGFVRHCHGDLHMANICVVDGRPLLFDCIEFDPALAIIDTLYDLSFLLMDLWHHGQRAAAAVLMNRYCDISGEGAGLEALPLFLSMRAAVRAHVTMTMAGAAGNAADPAARTQAEDYLAAALAFLRPAPARLVAVGGLSGTGKSTLALALSPLVGAPPGARVLRSDVLRKRLAGVPPETRLPPERYTPAASAEVYRTLVAEAAALVGAGVTAIADAVFADPAERRAIAAAAGSAPFTGLWLEAGADVLRRRVGARAATAADASDATVSVVERQLGADIGDLGGWHRLAAGGTIGDMIESAMHCLDAGAARCR